MSITEYGLLKENPEFKDFKHSIIPIVREAGQSLYITTACSPCRLERRTGLAVGTRKYRRNA